MADSKVVYVQPYQVKAAKLAVRLAKEQGKDPNPLMVRIANAKPTEHGAAAASA